MRTLEMMPNTPNNSTNKPQPRSCDTFVALPPASSSIIFAKNSDRPDDEVQEVAAIPAATHPSDSTVKCTYITIPQVAETHAVIVSKPVWMWGAEMAANNVGLVIGNEAVWTTEPDGPEALLGMDLVRLAAERCSTAAAAVDTIADLLATYGQGGGCEEGSNWSYHNSFLIADKKEAWVMETAGKWWVAERITQGVRNISNTLSIRFEFDKWHPDLFKYCDIPVTTNGDSSNRTTDTNSTTKRLHGLDWAARFSSGGAPPAGQKSAGREKAGYMLLQQAAESSGGDGGDGVTVEDMMDILRDKGSGICMCGGGFTSTGSQVSIIQPEGSTLPDIHCFTAAPDPSRSAFKPFIFPTTTSTPTATTIGSELTEAKYNTSNKRVHKLWQAAQTARQKGSRSNSKKQLQAALEDIEAKGLALVESSDVGALTSAYKTLCEEELQLYEA